MSAPDVEATPPGPANAVGASAPSPSIDPSSVQLTGSRSWLRENLASISIVASTAILIGLLLAWSWERGIDRDAVIASVLFLLLGFFIIFLAKRFVGIQGDALFVSIIFMPMLVFLILSGKISNITAGVSSISATFNQSISQLAIVSVPLGSGTPVLTGSPTPDEPPCLAESFANSIVMSPPEVPEDILREFPSIVVATNFPTLRVTDMPQGGPIAYIRLRFGGCRYSHRDLAKIVQTNARSDAFKFVVLVKEDNVFQAYIPAFEAARLLNDSEENIETLKTIVAAINRGDLAQLQQFPGVVFSPISVETTNIGALREMNARGLDALVVVGAGGQIEGILSREQVLTSMMLELASREQ